MGTVRNGARTFLNLMAQACRMSRLPGFRTGITTILGPDSAELILNLWDPLCAAVDALIAADNFFNQVDFRAEQEGDEDRVEAI